MHFGLSTIDSKEDAFCCCHRAHKAGFWDHTSNVRFVGMHCSIANDFSKAALGRPQLSCATLHTGCGAFPKVREGPRTFWQITTQRMSAWQILVSDSEACDESNELKLTVNADFLVDPFQVRSGGILSDLKNLCGRFQV